MDSPMRRFGSKSKLIPFILPLMPPHLYYNEAFFGGGSVFFAKHPAEGETINDLDREVINFFRVLSDPVKKERFIELATLTPYSRFLFETCRDSFTPRDDIEQAWRFFVVNRMSYGAKMKQWSYSQTILRQKMYASTQMWLKGVHTLPEVYARLLVAQIEEKDFREEIPLYDTPDTLHYLDPPYVPETRVSGGYDVEMTTKDHLDLVELSGGLQGMVMLSGYAHSTYDPLERWGWVRHEFPTVSFSSRKRTLRTECLWLNPAAQTHQQMMFSIA